MRLKKVTLTGADDSIRPRDLLELTLEFPFVEWGLLVSAKQMGKPRFPSAEWLKELKGILGELPARSGPNLSIHVCGRWVRDIASGNVPEGFAALPLSLDFVKRFQLNFHAEPHEFSPAMSMALMAAPTAGKEIIAQYDGVNEKAIEGLGLRDVVPLFDASHGAGLLPNEWPKTSSVPDYPIYGYAGGLGPDNLPAQLGWIEKAAGEKPFWVDMETKVRSNDDALFDLDKCKKCLEACEPFVMD